MKFQDLQNAQKILNLGDHANMKEIKESYKALMNKWHPDKGNADVEECEEMSKKITVAYDIIMTYCSSYQYSFTKEAYKKGLSGEDWWYERFGKDPMWGP